MKSSIKFNPTEAQKEANDFEMAKQLASNYLDSGLNKDRIKSLREDLDIHHGRWPAIEEMETGYEVTLEGEDGPETFRVGNTKLRHFDKVGRITRGMHGTIIAAPMVCIIKDISSKSKSIRDKLRLEGVKELLYNKYVVPKTELITAQELQKLGAQSMFQLPPEQQDQVQSIISQRIQKESPEEIMAIMEKTKTPDEQVCQLLFGYTASKEKLKMKYDIGGEFAIANGEEYYRPHIVNGYPKLDVLIPEGVKFGGSPAAVAMGVQYGTFATYQQQISIEDAIARFGMGFLQGDIKNIDKYYNPVSAPGYTGNSSTNRIDIQMTEIIGKDEVYRNTNFLTRDGQTMLNALYARLGASITQYMITHYFATFKWTQRMKVVTRLFNNRPKEYIVAYHYRFNPDTDLKIRTIIVPQVWDVDRLGTDWYPLVGPKEYQYDSILDPFNPKLSIYGGQYNTLLGTTKNYSLVGNGKIWNFRYDQAMAKIDEIRSTDHGKIAIASLKAKPPGMKWEIWLNGLLTTKIGLSAEGIDNELPGQQQKRVFQVEDLSRTIQAAEAVQELEFIEREMQKAMFSTEASIGGIGEYTTNQNAALQLEGANRQLLSFYNRHREITTEVSNAMLRLSIIGYRDNEYVKNILLDDFLKTHYELNMTNEDISQYALVILDTITEVQAVKRMTDLALSFVQTGIISLKELSRLFSAQTMAEAQDIIDEAEAKREKKEELDYKRQQDLQAQNEKAKADLLKLKQDFDALQNDLDRKMKIALADIANDLLSNASDIDGNKVNDALTKALAEIKSQEKITQDKLAQQNREHNDMIALEYAKLKTQQIIADKRKSAPAK